MCPRLFVVAVACCCLSQLSCNLPVPMSAPNPGRFSIVVSVSRMHFSSSGGVIGKCGFRRTSCRIIVIICDVLCLFVRCACSSDLPPLLIALDRSVGVSCVLWALSVFSVVVRVSALGAGRTRAVLERNRHAACFCGCCGALPTPLGPCCLLGALWKAQEPTCTKKPSSRAVYFQVCFDDADNGQPKIRGWRYHQAHAQWTCVRKKAH